MTTIRATQHRDTGVYRVFCFPILSKHLKFTREGEFLEEGVGHGGLSDRKISELPEKVIKYIEDNIPKF